MTERGRTPEASTTGASARQIRYVIAGAVVVVDGILFYASGRDPLVDPTVRSWMTNGIFVLGLVAAPMLVYLLLVRTLVGSIAIGLGLAALCVVPLTLAWNHPDQGAWIYFAPAFGLGAARLFGICDRVFAFLWPHR